MTPSQPVAIVGIGCRFPGDATSPSKLWNLYVTGRDGCSAIPKDRFNVKSLYDVDGERVDGSHVLGGYFLKEDAMDPQIRLLLEIVYEATENAGIPIEKLAGSNTSVFSGYSGKDYHDIQAKDPETLPSLGLTGNSTMMFANRVSQFYDLQGPSMTIDTGCSSGLVALHQGCQTIHSAQGYSRGEGVAALILKSFDAAIKDRDHVHAVIRDTGVCHNGNTTTITSPSMAAQIKLIETCYKRAGLDLSRTGYVEAHMTGTKVEDAVEAEALAKTFGKIRAGDPILVGSVKANIGHTEAVSGLAAIVKTAFTLKYSQIVPNPNFKEINPEIDLDKLHLRVPTRLTDWPHGKPLRASINSFGYGGTNVHVILEVAPPMNPRLVGMSEHSSRQNGTHSSNRHRVYVLSAKDSAPCLKMAKNIAIYLRRSNQEGHEPYPGDLAYTLLERRSHLPWVVAIRASRMDELAQRLEQPTVKPRHATKQPRLGFVFNGQGAQWYAMGRELITTYPVFNASIHKAGQTLKDYGATWSLYDELMLGEYSTRVAEIDLSQTISVALQLCLVDLLKSWGITPSAVTSHSSGEIATAYAISALSFKEALGVVYLRGELTLEHQKSSSLAGGMLAVGIGFD
ncbi:thiolase-like protein [Usnea florida]